MQIKMRETAPGSPDGVQVNTYTAGETYDVPADLADCFLRFELADPVTAEPKPKRPAKTKNAGAAPENKAS